MIKKIAYVFLAVIFLGVALGSFRFYKLGVESQNTTDLGLGLKDGRLSACGDKPNCVSSTATDEQFVVRGFSISQDPQKSFSDLVEKLAETEEVQIEVQTDVYAHLSFRSRIFGFTDDLELHLHPELGKLDVRSSSRVGYSDLGANRKRVEMIREQYFKANTP